jgi:RimJ/RimL family protein N-acetyltransferase
MTEPTTETEWWRAVTLPSRIETARLLLRPHAPGDGPALKRAIDENLEHLQRWMDWAMNEPSPLDALEARITMFAEQFTTGPDWGYGIRLADDPDTLIGGTGMHARIGPNALEIGYWLDERHTGRGFATEAAAALTKVAFSLPMIDRVEIRCDPANVASAAIPRRLGFAYVTTLDKNAKTPTGEPRDTMVFAMTRSRYFAPTDHS